MHNNKTICLNMIVKNEAHVIASTLENLCSYILFDYWVIVDTGSTDDTKQIISDFFKNKNINGELHETKWKNFGFNRSDALTKAYNKTDYLLIFDADDRVIGDFVLPKELNLDGYHLKFGNNFSYIRLLLVNNRLKWKFMGVLHEYIICTNENYHCKFDNIEGNYYLVSGKSGARSNNPNKYRDDAMILEAAYHEAKENKDDIMVRYSFYCAQSYKDAGSTEKSIEWYKKRIEHGGWNQEVYYSYITIGNLYAQMNNMESAFYYWALSFDADPERCEGIYSIIKKCREKGYFKMAYRYYQWIEKNKKCNLLDKLFVTENIYKYLLDYEFTVIACYVNQHKSAIASFHSIFKYANANVNEIQEICLKENIVYNLTFYVDFIEYTSENLTFFYDYMSFIKGIYLNKGHLLPDIVTLTNNLIEKFTPFLTHYDSSMASSLTNLTVNVSLKMDDILDNMVDNHNAHNVILTITSCKRFDLFQKTMNSFINNCNDIDKITYFFCVDDNSSDEDREQMMRMYPFFNFYFKNSEEKGHRQSMNIIWNKLNELKPKFYLHLEDDWLFINKCNYISESISFLERFESEKIHQILFNKNYAEIIDHYNIVGGNIINGDNKFKLHIKDEPNLCGSNCAYWPHFSFRPSVIRTSAVLTLGNFDSPNTFFERDYADKYFNAGYASAYFNEVNSIHVGKLTSESQSVKKNAYQLNDEEQFFNTGNTNVIKAKSAVNKIKVINLLRRLDRKDNVIQNLKNANITNYEFIEAVDGNTLIPTSDIITLFKGNDFGNRRGVIGCALTHYNLWKKLIESEFDYFLIVEDDFKIVESFKAEIEKINFEKYDILLMGYHMFSETLENVKSIYYNNDSVMIEKLRMDYYIGGIHCYSINKCGARKLLDYIDKNGIKHGIDYLFKIIPELECFETRPHISFAEWNEGGKAIDSDIQNIYDSIDLSDTFEKLLEKYNCYPNQDFFGSDICHIGNQSLFDQLLIAQSNSECVCFNTLGYFKREVNTNQLKTLNGCDLYVKKHINNINNNEKVDNDDGYVFIQGLDQKDCDLYNRINMSVKEMKVEADKNPNCVCFNTLGFFKNNIYHLITSPYFSNKDGLYVKKEHYNKYVSIKNDNNANILDSIHNSNGTYCFIHSCSLRDDTDILDEIIDKVKKIHFDVIFIINIGNKINKVYGNNVVIIEYSNDVNLFEMPTLNMMHSFCIRNPESKILYLHTKGVSYHVVSQTIVDWRNMMLYFLIDNYCKNLLEKYDIVGCNYLGYPHRPHFSGNFWWTKASYVNKLSPIPIKTAVKHDAEWWIFSDNKFNPSYYLLHSSDVNHYCELYPLEKYKENEKIIRVKMLCNWCSSKDLCNTWSNMCESGYRWKNIEITWDDSCNIDYWVIINKPCDNSYFDPKRTIVFQMEPWVYNESHLWGVKTWEKWANPENFMEVRGRRQKCHNNAFWELELNLNEILNLKVENRIDVISSMCSSKYYDEGHIARIDFLKFLEQKGDVKLDIYSWDNQHNFKNFRGAKNHYFDKSKGYIPYKYYFMVENNYEENFITEKLWEPILCETLVFYYGCPNVCDYIDAEAFVQLDMNDFEKSYQIIKQAIKEDWWSMRIEAIRREKNKILNELAFFPVIENIINKSDYVNVKLQTIHSKLQINHGSLDDELPEQKMSVKYLTGNEKVLEIGGNIGRNSLVIASILKNNSDFVSLECDVNIANQLIENRDLNHFNFHVENSALSKRKLIQKNWDTIPSDTLEEGYTWVNTITLDELKCKYKINFDTLVLDCEGAFYYILMDMPEILDNVKLIIMENDYYEKSKKEFVDETLLKNNFYVAHQEAGGWGPCYHNFFEVWKKYIF